MKYLQPLTFASLVWKTLGYSEDMWENFDLDMYSGGIIPYTTFTIRNPEYGADNCLAANGTATDFVFAHDESDPTKCLELYMEMDYDEEYNEDCMNWGLCNTTYGRLTNDEDGDHCLVSESITDGGVDASLGTWDAGTVVGAALLRTAVDGVSGLAGRAVEVGGGLVPVAGLGGGDDGEHAHHVLDGLLDHLSLGGVFLGIRRLESNGGFSLQ